MDGLGGRREREKKGREKLPQVFYLLGQRHKFLVAAFSFLLFPLLLPSLQREPDGQFNVKDGMKKIEKE